MPALSRALALIGRAVKRAAKLLAMLAVLAVTVGFVFETVQRAVARRAFPAPGRLIDIGTHRLHLYCKGAGNPAILLEAGLDVRGSLSWSPVHDDLATLSRTCAYDRAGINWSEPGPDPRSGPTIARELNALLTAADVRGPFILVGHSLGGIYMREFADLDRSAVAGLVFVDASHPEQWARLPGEALATPPAALQVVVEVLNRLGLFRFVRLAPPTPMSDSVNATLEAFRPYSSAGMWKEFGTMAESASSVSDSPDFGSLPLIVLTAGGTQKRPNQSAASFEHMQSVWHELHRELAALSTAGSHSVVPDAAHYIHVDRPSAVIDAVADVLEVARRSASADPP